MHALSDIRNVAVYCASSTKIAPAYFDAAWRLGEIFAKNGIRLVFGAGKMGLMGKIADSIVAHGGEMTGVIPQFMVDLNWFHPECTELIITKDMPDRKTAIWQHADALVALPGGIGTLDELSEVMSLKQLGILRHPIVIINLDGYYDQLLHMLEGFIGEQFMSPVFADMFRVVTSVEDVIPAILEQDTWSASAAQKHTHI